MVLVLIQSSKLFKYYLGVGCLHSTLSIWDLGPLTLSGDRGQPDGEYPWPHSPRAPSCRCCLVGASTGSGVLIGLVWFRGLTPQQQPGSYQGGEMMMKSVFWWRKPEHPEETTDLRQVTYRSECDCQHHTPTYMAIYIMVI